MLKGFFLLTMLTLLAAGCGSNSATTDNGTGMLAARLVWDGNNSSPKAKATAKAAAGVATVRIIVTGAGMSDVQKDFPAADNSGVINGIPAGSGRTVKAQGMDSSGLVIYQGSVSNVTIHAGQTTDAGVITMQSMPSTGSINIIGVAAMGPINGATVKVYTIRDGKVDRTAEIASGTTFVDGAYSVFIPAVNIPKSTEQVLVEVTGGTFTDAATGAAGVALKTPLQAAVSTVSNGAMIAVTPMTHLAVKQVEGIGAFSAREIDDANMQIGRFFQVDDIIRSQPFDPTQSAPPGASFDQMKYAWALGVFSQFCDSRRGVSKLEDAISTILADLGKELNDNAGFSATTLGDFNDAIDSFNGSGRNKGGVTLGRVDNKGGVLQIQTTGTLPANTDIIGLDFTVKIPAGVTFNYDAATGKMAAGVVAPASSAASGGIVVGNFDTASRTLHILLLKVNPGMNIGEFAHIEFGLSYGVPLPDKADFAVTVKQIFGGSITNPDSPNVDLVASGIGITQKSVAGL